MAFRFSPLHLLIACLAGWINQRQQRLIEYLLAENRVLRQQIGKRPKFTDRQRRLLAEKAKAAGRRALATIDTIVTPDTLLRWHQRLIAQKWTFARRSAGRPPTPQEVADLVVQIARENPAWGYDRIAGALANLGHELADNTVKNILLAHGLEPAPRRRKQSRWKDFLRMHWETLAATDFFTAEVWTKGGLVTFFVLFVMELKTRRVEIAGITAQPDSKFMAQVARNLTDFDGFLLGKSYLLMDRDAKFTAEFRGLLKSSGIRPPLLPPRSPNLNAYAERFVRSIKEECLDRMIFFGQQMLERAVKQFVEHYHVERNHQGLENKIITPEDTVGRRDGPVECRQRLGGLLKYYHRRAA